MKKTFALVLFVAVMLSPWQSWAIEDSKSLTLQNAATATGNGTAFPVDGFTSVAVQVTIAATATVTFEVSQNGSTWASVACSDTSATNGALATTATTTGTYQCGVAGMASFRARISSWGSGAVTVTARATTAPMARRGGGAGGSGAPTDATYIMQTANGDTSAEQALGSLATGCLGSATTTGVVSARTITGTSSEVSVANGDCSGNPTISLPSSIDLSGKSVKIPSSTTLPATCAVGQIYMDTDATTGQRLYLCESANTWALQGDGGAGTGMTHGETMVRISLGF